MTTEVSKSFEKGDRIISKHRKICNEQWRKASKFAIGKKSRPIYLKYDTETEVCYSIPSQFFLDIYEPSAKYCDILIKKTKNKDFYDYKNYGFNMVFQTEIDKNNCKDKSTCTIAHVLYF